MIKSSSVSHETEKVTIVEKNEAGEDVEKLVPAELVVSYDYPGTAAEAIERFGDETVNYFFVIGASTAQRNKAYSITHGKNAVSVEAAKVAMKDWAPALPTRTKADEAPSLEKLMKQLSLLCNGDEAKLQQILSVVTGGPKAD